MTKRISVLLAILLLAQLPAVCEAAAAKRELRIGFIYISPIGDAGWSYAHDVARRKLGMDPANITYFAEGVSEGAEAQATITSMSERGYDVVVTTSFNFMNDTIEVARNFPGVTYLHCSGYKTAENVSAFFGRMYQARYLSGLVAGRMTKSNIVGFVAAHAIPEVKRGINAFTLGVRDANPDAEVRVIWTETWYDPFLERDAAKKLVELGADVLAQDQDSATVQVTAQQLGVYSVGYNTDMAVHAPKAHLVAAVWDWSVFYKDVVEKLRAGTWKSGKFWPGMETGIVDISPFGPMVHQDVKDMTLERRQAIIDGSLVVFKGPVLDNEGKERIAAGVTPDDHELLEMDWLVQGVSVVSH